MSPSVPESASAMCPDRNSSLRLGKIPGTESVGFDPKMRPDLPDKGLMQNNVKQIQADQMRQDKQA
jgi:hypothetical protein